MHSHASRTKISEWKVGKTGSTREAIDGPQAKPEGGGGDRCSKWFVLRNWGTFGSSRYLVHGAPGVLRCREKSGSVVSVPLRSRASLAEAALRKSEAAATYKRLPKPWRERELTSADKFTGALCIAEKARKGSGQR